VLSEFIILMIARHLDCDYEWSVHAPICKAAGVSDGVIEALGEGRKPHFDDEAQRIVHEFVSQLLRRNRVEDAAFEEFHAMFGERGVVEVAATMGYYCLAGFMLNAVDMPPRGEALPTRKEPPSGE
jgi:4-carboxymuconolactone decarboxylase